VLIKVEFILITVIIHPFHTLGATMSSKPIDFKLLLADLFPRPKTATLPAAVIEAVRLYNLPQHKELLSDWLKKKNKNAVDAEGLSLLHHATLAGRTQLVAYFLQKGLQKDLENVNGFTPLILAVQQVKEMKPDLRKKVITCIETLLKAGAKMNSTGVLPQIAVNIAASNGDLDVLKQLEAHGAQLNEDVMGTPLWWATNAKVKNPEFISYLESKECKSTIGAPL
jgi:hypothetical protein